MFFRIFSTNLLCRLLHWHSKKTIIDAKILETRTAQCRACCGQWGAGAFVSSVSVLLVSFTSSVHWEVQECRGQEIPRLHVCPS